MTLCALVGVENKSPTSVLWASTPERFRLVRYQVRYLLKSAVLDYTIRMVDVLFDAPACRRNPKTSNMSCCYWYLLPFTQSLCFFLGKVTQQEVSSEQYRNTEDSSCCRTFSLKDRKHQEALCLSIALVIRNIWQSIPVCQAYIHSLLERFRVPSQTVEAVSLPCDMRTRPSTTFILLQIQIKNKNNVKLAVDIRNTGRPTGYVCVENS